MGAHVTECPSCGTKNRLPVAAAGHPRCPKCHTDLPWLVDAGDADFAAAIDTSQLVVVDLWAEWCGPCKLIAPVLHELAEEYAGRVKVVKVDVDRSAGVARRYEARSIPMVLFFRDGEVIDTVVGAQPRHVLRGLIEQHV